MKISSFVQQHAHEIMVALTVVFVAHFFALGALNHSGLRTQLTDLGHMEQSIWSAAQGDPAMTVSDPGPVTHSRLREHANFIFYLISPLYLVFPSPYLLILLGTVGAGLGGYFLFRLTQSITSSNVIALIFGTALLLNPMVHDTVLYDFHPLVFVVGLVPFVLLMASRRKWTWYWVGLALLLTLKEDIPLLIMAMAPFIFLYHSRKQGVYTFTAAALYWVLILYALPAVTNIPIASYNWYRLGDAGTTPEQAITHFATHPNAIVKTISYPQINYLLYLAIQAGPLIIFAPLVALIALPNIGQNVLVATSWQSVITGVYYSGPIITVLYCAAAYGYTHARTRFPRATSTTLRLFVLQVIIFSLALSPAPYSFASSLKDFGSYYDHTAFEHMRTLIPANASLAAQANLAPHFSQRSILVPPNMKYPTDYALFQIADPAWNDNGLFFLRNKTSLTNGQTKYITDYLSDPNYGLIAHEGTFYLFKRGAKHIDTPELQLAIEKDLRNYAVGIGNDRMQYSNIPRGSWLATLFQQKS